MPKVSMDTCYTAASSEVTGRAIARDAISLAYFAAASTIIGLAAGGKESRPEVALVVPYLTLLMCAKIAHHDFVISYLNRHLRGLATDKCSHFYNNNLRSTVWVGALLQTLPILCSVIGFGWASIAIIHTSNLTKQWFKVFVLLSPCTLILAGGIIITGRVVQMVAAYAQLEQKKVVVQTPNPDATPDSNRALRGRRR